jgi:hypothetical protein
MRFPWRSSNGLTYLIDGTHSLDILGRQTLDADWRSFQLAEMRMRWPMTLINFYSSILALSPQESAPFLKYLVAQK